jgi:hypothetical protein
MGVALWTCSPADALRARRDVQDFGLCERQFRPITDVLRLSNESCVSSALSNVIAHRVQMLRRATMNSLGKGRRTLPSICGR